MRITVTDALGRLINLNGVQYEFDSEINCNVT